MPQGKNYYFPSLVQIKDVAYEDEMSLNIQLVQVKDVSCGLNHTLVVDEKGRLFSGGKNDKGQLGGVDARNPYSHVEAFNGGKMAIKKACAG